MRSEARLETWKQIADFFEKEIRTVQRWEKTEGLPVHRHRHAKLDSVYAYPEELTAWQHMRLRGNSLSVATAEPAREPQAPTPQPAEAADESPAAVGSVVSTPRGVRARVTLAAVIGTLVVGGVCAVLISRPHTGRLGADLTPLPIFSLAGSQEYWPSLSPDGKRVVFAWSGASADNFDIYAKDIGAHSEERLTTDPAVDYSPVWSPDGRVIAFCRGWPNEHAALWILSLADNRERKLLDLNAPASRDVRVISWLPDGQSLILSDSNSITHQSALYVVDATTASKRQITLPPNHESDLDPQVSRHGALAYTRDRGLGLCKLHVVRLKDGTVIGRDSELSLKGFERDYIGQLAWTPDGTHIVFVSNHGGPRRLWITSVTDSASPQLLSLGDDTQEPAISADGRLAYVHTTFNVNIWRVGLHGHADRPTRVISSLRVQDTPKVSPNGRELVYVTNREGAMNIWTSAIDGSGATPVTALPGYLTGSPAWSPDGSQIAFDSRIEGKPAIYVVAKTGGKVHNITGTAFVSAVPAWAPDGRSIYFCSDRSGRMEVWKIGLDGGDLKQITEEGGFAPSPSPDGKYLYYARTGAALSALWRLDLSTGNELPIERSVFDRAFTPTRNGIYYVPDRHSPPYSLYFHSSSTGSRTAITTFDKPPHMAISVSPDGGLFFSRVDVDEDEILLINGFWRQ